MKFKPAVIGIVSALTLAMIASPAHASETAVIATPAVTAVAPSESAETSDGYVVTAEDEAQLAALISATDSVGLLFDANAARAAGATEQSIGNYAAVLSGASWTISGQVSVAAAVDTGELNRAGAEIMACSAGSARSSRAVVQPCRAPKRQSRRVPRNPPRSAENPAA